MGIEHWWNDTDRGNWSIGRETLYSVGGRWMNGYGALVEWYWQGKTEVLGEKYYIAWVVGEWMDMEHWWNVLTGENWSAGRETLYRVGGRWMNGYRAMVEWYWQGKTEVLGGKPLTTVPLVHHKFHADWPGIEHGPPRWEAGDWPPEQWHGHVGQMRL